VNDWERRKKKRTASGEHMAQPNEAEERKEKKKARKGALAGITLWRKKRREGALTFGHPIAGGEGKKSDQHNNGLLLKIDI